MHGTEGGGTGERGEVRDPVGEGAGPGEIRKVGVVSDGLSAEMRGEERAATVLSFDSTLLLGSFSTQTSL